MSSDDERAATERMRLLLVHDAESETRNLAPEPAVLDLKDEKRHLIPECFDLSRIDVPRFATRVAVTRETQGHRQATYSANATPAAKAPAALAKASVLLTEPSTEPALASSQDIAAREAATVRRREIPIKESNRDCDTVPEGRTIDAPRRRRIAALASGFIGAALLLIVIVASLTRGPRAALPAKTSTALASAGETSARVSESTAEPPVLRASDRVADSSTVVPTPEAKVPAHRKPPSSPRKPDSKDSDTPFDLGMESETNRF